MSKKYDNQGNITEAHRLAATGNTNSGRNSLEQQVMEAVAAAKELNLITQLAEHSSTTPDRIERISKGKIPSNENILAKIIVGWNKIKPQETAPDELSLARA